MIVTTTSIIEGKRITQYCGSVVGEAILGANVIRDLFAGVICILEPACRATCPADQPR